VKVIENALVLAATRRLTRPADARTLGPIRSLAYFLPVIEEVLDLRVSPDYVHTSAAGLNASGQHTRLALRHLHHARLSAWMMETNPHAWVTAAYRHSCQEGSGSIVPLNPIAGVGTAVYKLPGPSPSVLIGYG
jgi:hypothetical protein